MPATEDDLFTEELKAEMIAGQVLAGSSPERAVRIVDTAVLAARDAASTLEELCSASGDVKGSALMLAYQVSQELFRVKYGRAKAILQAMGNPGVDYGAEHGRKPN